MNTIRDCVLLVRIIMLKAMRRLFVLMLITLCAGTAMACPTCIGMIEHNSPTFFSDDAYCTKQEGHKAQMYPTVIIEGEEE